MKQSTVVSELAGQEQHRAQEGRMWVRSLFIIKLAAKKTLPAGKEGGDEQAVSGQRDNFL